MRTLKATDSEVISLVAKNEAWHIETGLNFLKEHRGLRPGSVHLFLGCTGAGKSTMVRTIVLDYIKLNPLPALIYLTEEKTEHFLTEVYKGGFKDKELAKKAIITSEIEKPPGIFGLEKTWLWLVDIIRSYSCKMFVIDNITTCEFYNDLRVEAQSTFAKRLIKLAEDEGIAIVLIAHTKADVNDSMSRLINENDIRGSKSIVNMCQFMYIMQRFKDHYDYHPTIRIVKHRSQMPKNKIFKFRFREHLVLFDADWPITFEEFNNCFAGREKLIDKRKIKKDIKIYNGGKDD